MSLKLKQYITLLLLTLCITARSNAQAPDIKFGKVSKEELAMTAYPLDPGASAVILFDKGQSRFGISSYEGFHIIFERHLRIKILDKSGYDWANFEIPLYKSDNKDQKELLTKLKAYTFNLDERGKQEKIKLSKSDLLTEKVSDNLSIEKLSMPSVKVGSVIDIKYSVKSNFLFNLNSWEFQKSIPVVWSEYAVSIPEYFHYEKHALGYIPFILNEHKLGNGSYRTELYYTTNDYHWGAQNIPAFEKEFGMTTANDYISQINFQLSSIKLPGQLLENVANSWETIAKDLKTDPDFWKAIKRDRFLEEITAKLIEGKDSDEQKLNAIYNWVTNTISWNEKNSYYTSSSLKQVVNDGIGNAADINLLLTAMLRTADLDASPVIMSTRSHGKVLPYTPMINQINYVISQVKIGENTILLDATDKLNPVGQLPFRCLNGKGLNIKENGTIKWVDLIGNEQYSKNTNVTLSFDDEMYLQGSQFKIYDNLSALSIRNTIKEDGQDIYLEKLSENYSEWSIDEASFDNLEDVHKPVRRTMKLTALESNKDTDIIYLDLLLGGEIVSENPFKKESRLYPIDYGCPVNSKYIMSLQIPEGYHLEEVPEQINAALPNNAGRYILSVNQNEQSLQVMILFSINNPFFMPSEYPILKEFYNVVIAKASQKIVLKKNTANAEASAH